ncbi:MAG: hypothetical protein WCO98_12110 [bacterium]
MKKFVLIAVIVICTLSAHADIYVGADARSAAMAGVGIATIDTTTSQVVNPATLSETGIRFTVQSPNLDMRTEGINFSEALKLMGSTKISASEAFKLAKDFGDGPSRLDINAGLGLGLPLSTVRANASVTAKIEPNAAFQTWVKGGSLGGLPPVGAQADIYGIGITTIPEVAVGVKLPVKMDIGTFSLGARVKPTTIYYSHYVVNSASVAGSAGLAAEMSGSNYIKKSSIGADLGLLYKSSIIDGLTIGVVGNNALAPKSNFIGTGNFAPRTYGAGATFSKSMLTASVDFNDVFHKFGKTQMSAGAEVRLPLSIALRAGYNTNMGFSGGLGIAGFNVSYAGKSPFVLSQMISF